MNYLDYIVDYNVSKCLDGDTSVITYRGHRIQKTLIRARFSPEATTGQRLEKYFFGKQ